MTVPVARKRRIITRDEMRCMLAIPGVCTYWAETADHRANRGQGGAGDVLDEGTNLVGACNRCNFAKEDSRGEVRKSLIERGLIVLPHATHQKTRLRAIATPVTAPDGRRFRLIDDDRREELAP